VQKVVSPPLEHGKLPSELRIDIGVKVKDQPDQGLHIIFCLDESGSMGGGPWNELIRALHQFWNTRGAEQGPAEYVSIVQFANSAQTYYDHVRLQGPPPALQYHSGGTMFKPPIQEAQRLITSHGGNGPVAIIFMSDGCSGDGVPTGILQELATSRGKNFSCYTVGFGSGADASSLQAMAYKNGRQDSNNYKRASIGALGTTFEEIADNIGESSASKVLVEKIESEIAKRVQEKICLEFL